MPLPIPKFIKTAFAKIGLRNNIPESTNNTTGAAGYNYGFGEINMLPEGAGGIPPDGKDFNGVFYDLSAAIQYAQSGVAFPFNQDFATAIGGYEVGAIVSDDSNKSLMWVNVTASNVSFPAGWTSFAIKDPTESLRGMPLVATQAELEGGLDGSKMVTAKKIRYGFSVSFSNIGHIALPTWLGGLIIQWGGGIVVPASNVALNVTLSTAWSVKMLAGLAGTNGTSSDVGVFGVKQLNDTSKTAISITQGGLSAQGAFFIAIGY